MKVAIVTQFPTSLDTPNGGVEAVSVNLVKALSKIGNLDIHVVTTDTNCTKSTISRKKDFTVHRLPRPSKGSMIGFATGKGRQLVSKYLLDLSPDIVHAHDTYGIMVKGLPIPRVFTIHGFIYGDTLISHKKFAWFRSKIWQHVEKSSWADQPNIISISPYVRERLRGIYPGTIYDIDNPIAENFFKINSTSPPSPIIFSAAVISPRKNTINLVKSVSTLKAKGYNIQLRLAGAVTNHSYGNSLQDFIRRQHMENSVHLLGRLDTKKIKKELARARIFALISLEENSPMGIEEAMAAGVPIVTSNRCGMPYMVLHGESGFLVDPFNPEKIAARIKDILDSDSLHQKMSQKSRDIAKERFTPDEVARRTYAVYREILNVHA